MFKEETQLSLYHLDKNTLEQPALYEEWSRKWADAVDHRDRMKDCVSIVKAEVDEEIRKDPSFYGWNSDRSPTETWISNKVLLHERVREANINLIKAQHDVNIFASKKETLEHRKKALEILTDLYKGNYFSTRSRSGERYEEAHMNAQEEQERALETTPRSSRRKRSES